MEKKLLIWIAAIGATLYLGYKLLFNPKAKDEPPKGNDDSNAGADSLEESVFEKFDMSNISADDTIEIEQYDMKFMANWFKSEFAKNKEMLTNKNLKAIIIIPDAMHAKKWEGISNVVESSFVQGIYDVQSEELIKFILVKAKAVSMDVIEIFGNKPMLILK